jgi:hypothetical protein
VRSDLGKVGEGRSRRIGLSEEEAVNDNDEELMMRAGG